MESKGPEDGPKTGRGHLFQSLERWKKGITATVVAATLLGGSMLLPAPSKTVAHAAMAPSLMQDEKGYISIFEKVRVIQGSSKTLWEMLSFMFECNL